MFFDEKYIMPQRDTPKPSRITKSQSSHEHYQRIIYVLFYLKQTKKSIFKRFQNY